jgi:hypothetical protein
LAEQTLQLIFAVIISDKKSFMAMTLGQQQQQRNVGSYEKHFKTFYGGIRTFKPGNH